MEHLEADKALQMLTDPTMADELNVWERCCMILIGIDMPFLPIVQIKERKGPYVMDDDGLYCLLDEQYPDLRGELILIGQANTELILQGLRATNVSRDWIEIVEKCWDLRNHYYVFTGEKVIDQKTKTAAAGMDHRKGADLHRAAGISSNGRQNHGPAGAVETVSGDDGYAPGLGQDR